MLESVRPKIEKADARPLNLYSNEYGQKGSRPSIAKMSTKEENVMRSLKGDPLVEKTAPFYASIQGLIEMPTNMALLKTKTKLLRGGF